MPHHQDTALAIREVLQFHTLFGLKRERFFAKNMLSILQGLPGNIKMRIRGRSDTDGINIRMLQDRLNILRGLDPGISRPDRLKPFIIQICAYLNLAIGRLIKNTDMIGAPMPASDNPYTYQDRFLSLNGILILLIILISNDKGKTKFFSFWCSYLTVVPLEKTSLDLKKQHLFKLGCKAPCFPLK